MTLHEVTSRSLSPLLTPDDVAEHLGISRRAVLDRARAYEQGNPRGLPGVKIAKEWRFTVEDVRVFLDANRSRPIDFTSPDLPLEVGLADEPTGVKSRRSALLG